MPTSDESHKTSAGAVRSGVRLDDVLDYLGERCTPEREAEIEAALDDPDSGISRFLDALGQPKGYSCSLDLFEGVGG